MVGKCHHFNDFVRNKNSFLGDGHIHTRTYMDGHNYAINLYFLSNMECVIIVEENCKNPPIVARQWLDKNVTAATNTHAAIE
jgi:hypothetical protein